MSLFVRELLLGPEAIPGPKRAAIATYLRSVIEQRGFPLHLGVLWNALYFDWDLDDGSYRGETLNPDRIEQRRFGDVDRALPVGGFVRVPAGDDEVWAEIVYKEGRHPEIGDDGVVPAHVSGAPGQVGSDGMVALREALVCDWRAFGPDFNSSTDLERLRRRRQLDSNRHLIMTACYSPEQAELDDATYYVHHLFDHQREGLLAEFVTDQVSDEELWAMLLNSFAAVEAIASDITEVRRWKRYFLWEPRYRAHVGDRRPASPIGADFFGAVFKSLATPPTERDRIGYAAVGPTIRDHLEAHGLDPAERAAMDGPGWARLVCYVNTYVADRVRAAPGASVEALGQRFHLRRDDAWQAGGVWRAERLVGGQESEWAVYPPLLPLGLGSRALDPGASPPPPLPPETVPAPVRVSEREWVGVLTAGEIAGDAQRLPTGVAGLLPKGTERVRLRLFKDESRPFLNEWCGLDRGADLLTGVPWTMEVFPGIKLFCRSDRGSDVIRGELRRLAIPIDVDGERIEWECDPAVVAGGRRRQPLRPEERRRASSLAELISRAFATRGERLPDGGRALNAGEVGIIVLGENPSPAAMGPLLRELASMELERAADGRLIWYPRVTRRTGLADAARLANYSATQANWLRARLRPHVVRMHLRRLPDIDPATWAGRARTYPEGRRRYHATDRLVPDLPPGYTYVQAYTKRGQGGTEEIVEE